MIKPILIRKLRYLILGRLLIVAVLLTMSAVLFAMRSPVYYGILSIFLGVSMIYIFWLTFERRLEALVRVQLGVDIAAITLFVHYTGGVDSVLATLYVLPILSAGYVLLQNGPMAASVLSSIFFVSTVLAEYYDWIPSFLPPADPYFQFLKDPVYCGYMAYVRVTIFILIGFLGEYLVRVVGQMEQNLRISEKFSLLGEMAMKLAHEIKNPLMAISGSIELLQDELKHKLDEEDKRMMDAVVQESQRLKDLFERVIDYARPETLDIQRLNLREALDEVFLLLEPFFLNEKKIDLVREDRSEPDRWVYADRNRLKQVFINIIFNAFQVMGQRGELTIRTRETAAETQVIFRDTGPGMNRKVMDDLFVPFRSHRSGGTGMGLAIAQKIVRSHGGRIKVKSQLGRGSLFIVSLPHAN
jgi:two-component system sensor histidine kinase PilS (NtrC family)